MKKFMAILLTVCCIVSSSLTAIAELHIPEYDEDFTIRNGIFWGMDKTKVKEAELSQGNFKSDITNDYYYIALGITCAKYGYESMYNHYNNISKHIVQTTVAGQKGLAIYTFDSEDKMNSLRYLTEYSSSTPPLTEMLTAKYGSPAFTDNNGPFETNAFEYFTFAGLHSKATSSLENYSGWLLEYNDAYVMVEAVSFAVYESGYGFTYYENITYSPITEKLFHEYQEKIEEARMSAVNDI